MPNASQHISPHHAAPCSEGAGTVPRPGPMPMSVEMRKDREGPSRLQSDVGHSTSEGAAERG